MTDEDHNTADLPWARQHESGLWEDEYGILGPYRPGHKARSDPRGAFPTGPAIGETLPNIVAPSTRGANVDVHKAAGGRAAVVMFYRSAVW